jgi:hypothetical protein
MAPLTYDQSRRFQSLDVYHTLVSGRSLDRSQQYTDGTTWTTQRFYTSIPWIINNPPGSGRSKRQAL